MCGIFLPALFLLVAMFAFTMARYVYNVPIQIERIIVFPMAVIPNLWGLWNMLYVRVSENHRIPISIHGPVLVLLIAPAGFGIAKLVGFEFPFHQLALIGVPVAFAVYYLAWKYVVSFLNHVLEIA